MKLKVLLPSHILLEQNDVLRLVAESPKGQVGFLPNRLDCVLPLVPGILLFETAAQGESYLAIDEGILVKVGQEVLVSVRHAVMGNDLAQLRLAVDQQFLTLDEHEQNLRTALTKLESGFMRRMVNLHHG